MNSPRTLISRAEYARRRGCARSAVTAAVKQGRITSIDGKIDPEQADRQWRENSAARGDSRSSVEAKALQHPPASVAGASEPAPSSIPAATPQPSPAPAPAAAAARDTAYSLARARREKAEASMAEIELARRNGELIDRAGFERGAFTAGRMVRDRLMNVPDRLAPVIASMTDPFEIAQRLREAIRDAIDDTRRGIDAAVA